MNIVQASKHFKCKYWILRDFVNITLQIVLLKVIKLNYNVRNTCYKITLPEFKLKHSNQKLRS